MIRHLLLLLSLISFYACSEKPKTLTVSSPDKSIEVNFTSHKGTMHYDVNYKCNPLLINSKMGLSFSGMPDMDSNMRITGYKTYSADTTWEQPWGEQRFIRDHHNGLLVNLIEKEGTQRRLDIEFRVFNDGLGFRYIYPDQPGADSVFITDELTHFAFADNYAAWHIPAYHKQKYEVLYSRAPISNLDTAHTPLTLENETGPYVSLHEAALTAYPSMTLYGIGNRTLKADLVPWKDGMKVKTTAPFKTPWRTIQVVDEPSALITSCIILNLNEPNVLGDVSWVKPMKYVGIWWGIHIGKWSFTQGPIHGATTENALQYIDFAAKNGFDEVLVEGWNMGWTGMWYRNFGPEMDFTTPTPDFDLFRVQEYARSKGVTLQGYNETCANTINYLSQIDSAFTLYEKLGYRSVKVGQVNRKLVNGEWHHGQYGVDYYETVVKKAAKHHLAINFHEPIKATGLRRTYPNLVSREGARGQEFNAWDKEGGNPPEHTCILPFTRLLAGPMDFTPGIFDITIPLKKNNQVNTTLAKQLALYVIIYSPIQMAADLIENYEGHPAFQFIRDVPVDWDTTLVPVSSIGNFLVTVRKDRHSDDWYMGAITDENSYSYPLSLGFLGEGRFMATIYKDAPDAGYRENPTAYVIEAKEVTQSDTLQVQLASGGGQAVRFKRL